jgi:hypothetical protein
MNNLKKLDNVWIGLLVGLLFPGLMFLLYWLFFHHQISFPYRFVRYLMAGYLLSNVIKICGLGNLLIFYFGLTYKLDKFSKGIVFSVLFYVALIAYVTYYHEPQYI